MLCAPVIPKRPPHQAARWIGREMHDKAADAAKTHYLNCQRHVHRCRWLWIKLTGRYDIERILIFCYWVRGQQMICRIWLKTLISKCHPSLREYLMQPSPITSFFIMLMAKNRSCARISDRRRQQWSHKTLIHRIKTLTCTRHTEQPNFSTGTEQVSWIFLEDHCI
jgi:hypothetical protein